MHKLVHFQNMRILSISAEGTYHRVFDVCIPKWLNQAGAKDEFVRLEDVGIHGNMHEMFLDRNSDEVIKFIDGWLRKNINNKTWLAWLGLAVLITAVAAVTGIKPKGTRHVAHTRLMGVAIHSPPAHHHLRLPRVSSTLRRLTRDRARPRPPCAVTARRITPTIFGWIVQR